MLTANSAYPIVLIVNLTIKKKEKSQTKIYENNKMFIEVGVFL